LATDHAIDWVNTIGTRPPRLDVLTLQRAAGKLLGWLRPRLQPAERPKSLRVHSPKMWPWFKHQHDRTLNRHLLTRALRPLCNGANVAITTLPIVADIMDELPIQKWVYYCVDDFSQWPGLDGNTLAALEARVIERADVCIAAGANLQARLARHGRTAALLEHGVDLDFWHYPAPTLLPAAWADYPKPWVVFWGVVDQRMDAAWIAALRRHLATGTILLVGPANQPPPALRMPGVVQTGPVPFAHLPTVATAADVLVMPYVDAPVTRAMQPLKLAEYLATGRPVVVRDLPANRAWADGLDVVTTAAEFAAAVRLRLQTGTPTAQLHARLRLHQESWSAKAATFQDLAQLWNH
jgi:hypothetical protein